MKFLDIYPNLGECKSKSKKVKKVKIETILIFNYFNIN